MVVISTSSFPPAFLSFSPVLPPLSSPYTNRGSEVTPKIAPVTAVKVIAYPSDTDRITASKRENLYNCADFDGNEADDHR